MEDPKSKKGSPQGAGVAAKGDSSTSNEPAVPATPRDLVSNSGETVSDTPGSPPPPVVKPPAPDVDPDATISKTMAATVADVPAAASIRMMQAMLQPGDLIGARYEILSLLGRGGMGSVYKALDREVGRAVALKLIRPELASNPAMLARFKQELLTATQVTHRNVIRIYDIADADGLKFITMEFVEGDHLRQILLDNGKLQPDKAVEIIRQVCLALDAAHSVGIIHRDLKPPNIMQEAKTRRIVVMDFGIARSIESEGMTQTGALIGTIEYMSPEQSMGKALDQRSDIFSVGLIFYELLTGNMPYKADSAMASLLRRNQERAIPVVQLDTSIPKGLSDIVAKCLERDLDQRYQSVQEILSDLEAFQGSRPVMASMAGTVLAPVLKPPIKSAVSWKWVGVGTLALVVAAGAWTLRSKFGGSAVVPSNAAAHAPVSVLVADFTNHTGDPIFDDTLEPMFNVALEGASFVNAYNRGDARRLAGKLPNPTSKLDEQASRLVAVSQGVSVIVTGALSRRSDGYRLSVEAIDAVTGKTLAATNVTAANKDEVLLGVPKVAAPIRKALGDTTPESVQLAATQGSFTASNLEAVHQYGIAMEKQDAGKMLDALQSFTKAAELDSNFARAYAGMAATSRSLGNAQDAQKYIKLALTHVDRMSERERYRIRGLYYLYSGDFPKCVEEYTSLVKLYPADNLGHNNLAGCYNELRNYPKALEELKSALQTTPNSAMYRLNISILSTYTGDFQTAEQQARTVLQSNPSFEQAYIFLAYSQLGRGQVAEAAESYKAVGKLSPLGASMSASGLADLALYEGRFSDAVRILESGAASDLAAKNSRNAEKFAVLAHTQLVWGHKAEALEAAKRALLSTQKVNVRFLVARVFVEAGEAQKARALADSLGSELNPEAQADAKLIEGEIALQDKDARKAIRLFTEANKLLESWMGRYNLGRAYLEAGLDVEAHSEFDLCLKWHGQAMELLDVPTYGYFPPVYYYLGRTEQGLGSPGAADFYRKFVSIQDKGDGGVLFEDAKKRLAELSAKR